MGNMHNLDSKDVNTQDILSIVKATETKVRQEIQDVTKAINELQAFFATSTPEFVPGEEPKFNSLNQVTYAGKKETILYQFKPENTNYFNERAVIIDQGMAAIPILVTHLRKELWKAEQTGLPYSPPFSIPTDDSVEVPKQNVFSKLNPFKKPDNQYNPNSPYYKGDEFIKQIDEVPYRWGIYKEYFVNCVAKPNRVTWSKVFSRVGMESMLQHFESFLSYWIVLRFLQAYKYQKDLELNNVTQNSLVILTAAIKQQQAHESQNPPGM